MELLKLLSTNEIIAQIISFLLLLWLMRRFFWRHILKFLDDRKARIAQDLKNIEDNKKEIERLKSEYQAQLNSIDETSREKIKEAQELAKKMAEQVRKDAHLEAENIITSARESIKYEIAKAREELKEQIVDLTIKSAESLIGEKLTEANDKRIVEEFLDQVDKA